MPAVSATVCENIRAHGFCIPSFVVRLYAGQVRCAEIAAEKAA
jgi:acyl CoA:acetate/3-ketoacid CoA transferase alpha subunit